MKKLLTLFAILLITLSLVGQVKVEKLNSIKSGTSIFMLEFTNYGTLLDSTRSTVSAETLKRNRNLDLLAKKRCLRMAKILVNSNNIDTDFSKEAHENRETLENTLYHMSGGVRKSEIESLGCDKVLDVITNSFFPDNEDVINGLYNRSPYHHKTRIMETHKEYGTYSIVLFIYIINPDYIELKKETPNAMVPKYTSKRILISYECFS